MNGDMKERTFHIQTQHKILGSDRGLEKIFDRKVDVLRVYKFRRRRFRRKGKVFLELHLVSMLDPSEHFLGSKVLRAFQSRAHLGLACDNEFLKA